MTQRKSEPTPEGYQRYVITAVRDQGDSIAIEYAGRSFGGIMIDELAPGVADSIIPGTELILRLHTAETGYEGQVAHMLVPHPHDEGWAEVYAHY